MRPALIGAKQAAQLLGIKLATLYVWCEQERIPFVRLGWALRFDPDELESWIELHRVRPRV